MSVKPRNVWIGIAVAIIALILVWQGVTASGNPNPTGHNISPVASVIDTAVLVFREGLECILVLSAMTASLVRGGKGHWKPIAGGAGLGLGATIVTWFVVVGIISFAGAATSELNIQAGTGLLAIIVLLVVMNWFFHRIYWTGWISFQNRKKKEFVTAMESEDANQASNPATSAAMKGLVILGLASVYREGFEVVLFLQNTRLQVGSTIVLVGCVIGFALTCVVGVLTFLAHRHLPYRKMLIFTGVMLGVVLLVMVGEQIQEMQQAGWIGTTAFSWSIPAWLGVWFSVYNNVESMAAQGLACLIVVGSYVVSQYVRVWRPRHKMRRAGRPTLEATGTPRTDS